MKWLIAVIFGRINLAFGDKAGNFIVVCTAISIRTQDSEEYNPAHESLIHKTIQKVSEDIENVKFNTAIAAMMALLNELASTGANKGEVKTLLKLLSPFAPHMAEELWEMLGGEGMISVAPWPVFDPAKTKDDAVEIAVQICGKLRERVMVPTDAEDDAVIKIACETEKVKAALENGKLVKSIVVKNKLVNLIIK